jgi:hypothetical protein
MNVGATGTIDFATAPTIIAVSAPVESPLFSFLEDVGWGAALEVVGLDVGVLDGLVDPALDTVVDNGARRGVIVIIYVVTLLDNDYVFSGSLTSEVMLKWGPLTANPTASWSKTSEWQLKGPV